MSRINNSKIVDSGYLPLTKGCARFVPSFVGNSFIPHQNGQISCCLFDKDKPILPPMNGRGFV